MEDNYLFEYAVLRIVPRVEREEFINAGVVIYCPKLRYVHCKWQLDEARIAALFNGVDLDEMKKLLHAFEQVCIGNPAAGPIAQLPPAGRFRWLTATRSTILQTSKVHTGLCTDGDKMMEHIFRQQVEM